MATLRYILRTGGVITADANSDQGWGFGTIDVTSPEFVAYRNPPPTAQQVADAANLAAANATFSASYMHGKTEAQIISTVQADIDSAATLSQLKAALRNHLSVLAAAVAATSMKDQ